MIEERSFDSLTALSQALAGESAAILAQGLAARGRAFMAVSGGRTPANYLPVLARQPIDWARVVVTLTDERWVGSDQIDSNEALVRKTLSATGVEIVGLKTDHASPRAAKDECETRLAQLPWPLDLILLGMGDDGHIASLFPGDLDWPQVRGRCHAVAAAGARQARMSLAPVALLDARQIFLAITGSTKERMLRKALSPGPSAEIPARVVLCQKSVPVRVFLAPT